MFVRVFTSEMSGIFSIRQGASDRMTAGMMATAAFFAPLMVTSPVRRLPPLMTYLSKITLPNNLRQPNGL